FRLVGCVAFSVPLFQPFYNTSLCSDSSPERKSETTYFPYKRRAAILLNVQCAARLYLLFVLRVARRRAGFSHRHSITDRSLQMSPKPLGCEPSNLFEG